MTACRKNDGLFVTNYRMLIAESGYYPAASPLLVTHDLDMDVDPEALRKMVAISSGWLDLLPQGGYVVTVICSIAGETHRDAFLLFCALTVSVPVLVAALAVVLYSLGL